MDRESRIQVERVLTRRKRRGSARNREGMARFAGTSKNTIGGSVAEIRRLAKNIGRNHDVALALWDTAVYEARVLTAFIYEPGLEATSLSFIRHSPFVIRHFSFQP